MTPGQLKGPRRAPFAAGLVTAALIVAAGCAGGPPDASAPTASGPSSAPGAPTISSPPEPEGWEVPESDIVAISAPDAGMHDVPVDEYDKDRHFRELADPRTGAVRRTIIFDPERMDRAYYVRLRLDLDQDGEVDHPYGRLGLAQGRLAHRVLLFMHANSQGFAVGNRLDDLSRGSRIELATASGWRYEFAVTGLLRPDKRDPTAIFENQGPDITLFTCVIEERGGVRRPSDDEFHLVQARLAQVHQP